MPELPWLATLAAMLRTGTFALFTLSLAAMAGNLVKPEKLTIHTWVREDLFAGWMVRDQPSFDRGVRKLDAFLESSPNDKNGLAWKYFVLTYRMREALAGRDIAAYEKHLADAKALRGVIFDGEPRDSGPYIIVGYSLIGGALHAPEADQKWMYRDGREMLRKVQVMQGPVFERLPPHMRGELWSALAVASDRLGDREDRDRVIGDMLVKLAGSPYESRPGGGRTRRS